ncbi:sensor histidine kinase [Brevundimonas subvibrioides]|uniref:sensor histidine kinase n=1 Tax=Brevundimonas subvibrioides TaxID=74313 RepID=UPI0022B2D915|nr:HAMP domain-containing sensor histidine kinase [Brevundimonas subvibrioides]
MADFVAHRMTRWLRAFGLPLLFVAAAVPAAAFSNGLLSAARSAAIDSLDARLDGLVAVLRYGDLPFLRLEIDRQEQSLPAEGRIAALADGGMVLGDFGSLQDRERLGRISADGPSIIELSTGPVLARRLDLGQTPIVGLEEVRDLSLYVADPFPGPAEQATRLAVTLGWSGFAAAVLVSIGLQLWYRRQYRTRLDRLNQRLRTIGQGDLSDLEPEPDAPGELAELRTHINLMLGDLRDLVFGLNAFVETVAHELRTPLTRMRLSADQLLKDTTADRLQEVERLKGDVIDLSRLFESLVDLAKARAGRFDRSAFVPVDLSRLLSEIREDQEEDLALVGHPLVTDIAADIRVLGDASLIRRLVENLLDNARKFSDPGGSVSLLLVSDDDRFRLAVQNPGPPFPQTLVTKSGEALPIKRSGQGLGLGLGLGIVRAIALKHGWALRVSYVDGMAVVELQGKLKTEVIAIP